MDGDKPPVALRKTRQLGPSMEHMQFAVTADPVYHTPSESLQTPEEKDDYGVPTRFEPPRKTPTRPTDPSNVEKRTDPFTFGSRYLEEGDDIFEHNAWDHVETDDSYKEFAQLQYAKQREAPVSDFDKERFNKSPEKFWNLFYANNTANFFKNRKWLAQEFPILSELCAEDAPACTLLEVGAGAGNTAFPILAQNKNKRLRIHACDFSKKAVDVIRRNEEYDERFIQADVWDVAAQPPTREEGVSEDPKSTVEDRSLPPGLGPESVDVVILIFIFSALSPLQWAQAIINVHRVLKPGGLVLFRDYGRGDLAQVRFKKGRWMEENFYVRGDGTRVYFFEEEELKKHWVDNPPPYTWNDSSIPARFELLNIGMDRRLLVNRQRRLKMYRAWIQAQLRKPGPELFNSRISAQLGALQLDENQTAGKTS